MSNISTEAACLKLISKQHEKGAGMAYHQVPSQKSTVYGSSDLAGSKVLESVSVDSDPAFHPDRAQL